MTRSLQPPHFQDYIFHLNRLTQAGLAAADPAAAVRRRLRRQDRLLFSGEVSYDLDRGRVFMVGAGKAALTMGAAAADILGDDLFAGVLIAKKDPGSPGGQIKAPYHDLPGAVHLFLAGHPISDQSSLEATAAAVELLDHTRPGDLVLCLISGGASALLSQPRLSLVVWQQLVDLLLGSGCTINELNTVRKRLDRVKGGGLARLAAPAACNCLVLSDVVGNPLDVIGSGPTVPNPDPPGLAHAVLSRYGVERSLPPKVWRQIDEQLKQAEEEALPAVAMEARHWIVGDVRQAAEAVVSAACGLGFEARLLTAWLEGEAREVGRVAAALAKDCRPGDCLVLGGETTVTLKGQGIGGRNQELALAAAIALDGWPDVALASFATDGGDGPTDAAGAIITGQSAGRGRGLGLDPLDYLARNDSYTFFQQTGELLRTGQTGTNVNDLLIILKY